VWLEGEQRPAQAFGIIGLGDARPSLEALGHHILVIGRREQDRRSPPAQFVRQPEDGLAVEPHVEHRAVHAPPTEKLHGVERGGRRAHDHDAVLAQIGAERVREPVIVFHHQDALARDLHRPLPRRGTARSQKRTAPIGFHPEGVQADRTASACGWKLSDISSI